MTRVYLSLGSNIDRHQHIEAGLDALAVLFDGLQISSVFESEAVGFTGDHFFNLVVGIDTGLTLGTLSDQLKSVELAHGRQRHGPKFSSRTLDIDILTYDNFVGEEAGIELPRAEITKNAFVLWPLAEIAPSECHPELGISYSELWQQYDKAKQALWPVDFVWHGQEISRARKVGHKKGEQ